MEQVDTFDEEQHQNDAAGALFDDIAPVLGNFVCGLSGRRLRIEEGDAAWTDGERIVLPPLIAALPNLDDNFQLAKIIVALLWAQTRFGTPAHRPCRPLPPTTPTPNARSPVCTHWKRCG